MKNKVILLITQINKYFLNEGDVIEWDRSINPPGEVMHINEDDFKLIILDSSIEDNDVEKIVAKIIQFKNCIEEPKGQWVINSKLEIKQYLL